VGDSKPATLSSRASLPVIPNVVAVSGPLSLAPIVSSTSGLLAKIGSLFRRQPKRRFFLYSTTSAQTIASQLGGVDYSYYFVLESYLPLLSQIGEVVVLDEPLDDAALTELKLTGQDYYLSFTPPNRVSFNQLIPVIPVFAWEFGTLPDEAFTAPEDDWNHVLATSGQAITHSQFARRVVQDSLGSGYPIASIPAPVWERCDALRQQREHEMLPLQQLRLGGLAIDSVDYPNSGGDFYRESILAGRPHDSRDLVQDNSVGWHGVHALEPWGRWTETATVGLTLPYPVYRQVVVSFRIVNTLLPEGHLFGVCLGDTEQEVCLQGGGERVDLLFDAVNGAQTLEFRHLQPDGEPVGDGERNLGIGLVDLYVRAPQGAPQTSLRDFGNLLEYPGFYPTACLEREPWGFWTRGESCLLFLPFTVSGTVEVSIEVLKNPRKQQGELRFEFGGVWKSVALSGRSQTLKLVFEDASPANVIRVEGIAHSRIPRSKAPQDSGLGIGELELVVVSPREEATCSADDDAIIYTTVFNPIDGRKNWPDIINAFVFALRDEPCAVLLLKLTHSEFAPFVAEMESYIESLRPFKCRIVFLQGFLETAAYQRLVQATHFVVNASRGEGQCLPLMEFMSSGVPAIAPDNTAMADYVTPDNAFVVRSSVEPAVWPHDPRQLLRTTRYRINWDSLYQGFVDSFRVATEEPATYRAMSTEAISSLQRYCSMEVGRERLLELLDHVDQGREQ
jgi:glycosyltransferase involved in cell wall biosynthesis